MPITERTLRKWRKKALLIDKAISEHQDDPVSPTLARMLVEPILRLTQELLDQHLIRKG